MAIEPRESADFDTFRHRALTEAARYGSDAWVFLRELLQNARDAGARSVWLSVERRGAFDRLTCRDDGGGMSYHHARRYLFALYASSKDEIDTQVGKFGIGFWSVLRFEPSAITIRSRTAPQAPWQVELDGALEHLEVSEPDHLAVGTEIVLERPAQAARDLSAEVADATRHFGRFLTLRDDPRKPLRITVDGLAVNAALSLPSPSASFGGRGFRGAVGLGAQPLVELFAHGLFVRSASSLQDLQGAGEIPDRAATEDALAELPSLAPRVLLDSAELDLLLARSDARYDKHLRRILRHTERQLGRLIQRQLQAIRPQPWWRPWLGALRDRLEALRDWLGPMAPRQLSAAALAGVVLGLALWRWLPEPGDSQGRAESGRSPGGEQAVAEARLDPGAAAPETAGREPAAGPRARGSATTGTASTATAAGTAPVGEIGSLARELELRPYRDLEHSYRGPGPPSLSGDSSRLALIYEPAAATPFFTALVIEELDGARWDPSPARGDLPRYRGAPCRGGCVDTQMLIAEGSGSMRIPVPTGHRLEASSIRVDGRLVEVFETAAGEAVLRDPPGGVLEFRTGPSSGATSSGRPVQRAAMRSSVEAPPELVRVAARIRSLPTPERVQAAVDFVARRIAYDRSRSAALAYKRSAESDAAGYVETALEVGAGDCDVQNGVLVTLLRLAGVEARLALGYVGAGGTVGPGLHAWVEYRRADGGWSVADASVIPEPGVSGPFSDLAQLSPGASGNGVRVPTRLAGAASPSGRSAQLALVGLLLAGLAAAAVWRRRRSAASAGAAAGEDLAALLGGALRHPEAFAGLPAMFHGRFVPLIRPGSGPSLALGGGAISLHRARRLARANRLFRSSAGSGLASRAARRRIPVIDAATAEGRVSSLALGAIDLDHWSSLLERGFDSELGRRINRRLGRQGVRWRLREASDLPQPWVEIALEDLRLGRRLILVDLAHAELASARRLIETRPEAACFTVLDALLHRLDPGGMEGRQLSRLLAAFARPAVRESALMEATDGS
ncbi:MAG: hypothetical protein GY719_27280 [bacterium]|nr:hypothetical protein [bacterium]